MIRCTIHAPSSCSCLAVWPSRRAPTPAMLLALERNDFLEVVTGHPESAAVADAVSKTRFEDKKARIAEAAEDPASAPVGDADPALRRDRSPKNGIPPVAPSPARR
jgi:hypothetical protein